MSIIFHIDMNSYFATVEQQANPHLRGKPVGICEHLGGIIIAASVEAKRFGIKTGTPAWEARKIYPSIILRPVDPPKIRHVTSSILKIFSDYTDLVERYSIDEAFLDVTNLVSEKSPWGDAVLRTLEIKQRIRKEVGQWLSCSVGVAENKLLAKIASDMEKPDGLTVVRPENIESLYDLLQLTDIPGIGVRMERRLNALGIFTIRQLRDFPLNKLRAQFGINGYHLWQMGHFRGSPEVKTVEEEVTRSMGHSYTMDRATDNISEMKKLLFKLSEKVARRLRARNMWGNTISCYGRFAGSSVREYFGAGKSRKISEFTNDGRIIFQSAWKIFESFANDAPLKMAGVTVSGLVENLRDEPLFERYKKPGWALQAMDKVNDRYGDFTLRRGLILDAGRLAGDTVGFGRMKEMKL